MQTVKSHHRQRGASNQDLPEENQTKPRTEPNLTSVFEKLTIEQTEAKKKLALLPIVKNQSNLLIDYDPDNTFLDIPKRPPWTMDETKEELNEIESKYFQEYLSNINTDSYFERNLEVWRQLWRVVEMSEIILVVVDIRNPLIHFSIPLYNYVREMGKRMVLVFNKIDLVSESNVKLWKRYFNDKFPEIAITTFSCNPKINSKNVSRRYYHSIGVTEVIEACRDLKVDKVSVDWDGLIKSLKIDLSQREKKAMDALARQEAGRGGLREDKVRHGRRRRQREADSSEESEHEEPADDTILIDQEDNLDHNSKEYMTIGLIGQPNVGKSSLINALKGRKLVSVSKTPGHTKHFQTIYLTNNLRLCDCPGLVFPSNLSKHLQILSGIYNISQVQDPFSCIRFVAESIPLIEQLKLTHPEQEEDGFVWSSWTICEAFAFNKGFLNAKSGRPDVYRGANLLLRMVMDGRILISFKPKGYEEPVSPVRQEHESDEELQFNKRADKKKVKKKTKQRIMPFSLLDEQAA
ncbi:Guanine nucleotide-binding-like protein 1 [Boothiomyces sp. JEL0838]|nr:Guanine nucleotide-binding-like protein 1 [Boothiomyces sp. JEL0838]